SRSALDCACSPNQCCAERSPRPKRCYVHAQRQSQTGWESANDSSAHGIDIVIHISPCLQTVPCFWIRTAAAQQRTQRISFDVSHIFERALLCLSHLSDLFFEGHH